MTEPPILAVIDPTAEEHPALQRAARVARKTGSPLELLICAFDPEIDADPRRGPQTIGGMSIQRRRPGGSLQCCIRSHGEP